MDINNEMYVFNKKEIIVYDLIEAEVKAIIIARTCDNEYQCVTVSFSEIYYHILLTYVSTIERCNHSSI